MAGCIKCGDVLIIGENWYASGARSRIYICNQCRQAYSRAYDRAHRSVISIQQRKYRRTDIQARIACNLRSRLRKAIKHGFKAGSAVRDLGCSMAELITHLEAQFQEGMSWDNHGEWHIDHIAPLAFFDLTDREQVKQVCHYTNLQPLWAIDNLSKGRTNNTDL